MANHLVLKDEQGNTIIGRVQSVQNVKVTLTFPGRYAEAILKEYVIDVEVQPNDIYDHKVYRCENGEWFESGILNPEIGNPFFISQIKKGLNSLNI